MYPSNRPNVRKYCMSTNTAFKILPQVHITTQLLEPKTHLTTKNYPKNKQTTRERTGTYNEKSRRQNKILKLQ